VSPRPNKPDKHTKQILDAATLLSEMVDPENQNKTGIRTFLMA
jgi:hypothetical protein